MQVDTRTILYKVAEVFDLKRGSTVERLKLQKTIYLLQAYGLRLGYGFSWYRYGPYSQDLVQDAYKVLHSEEYRYSRETSSWSFSKSSLERFQKFREICGHILDDAAKLELLASVDFVRKMWHQGATRSEMPGLFKTHKQRVFNRDTIHDSDIEEAYDLIDKLKAS
ncbi:MAG: hypothetical protein ACYSWZ_04920 [Planctomycetota bacterium]|jgi:uncharacterized protein YwgA